MQIISKAVGIDLGTTNSVVAVMDRADAEVILHRDKSGRETTPSCVWRDPQSNQLVVGHLAFSRRGSNPPPVRSIKRFMGQQVKVSLGGKDMSPEAISAEILKEMKRQIEEDTAVLSDAENKWIVDRAIVTVPAYFGQPAVQATQKAAELAGLRTLELLPEPTAAACYHCWKTKARDGLFLVYDLGGGTFDVTVLKATAGSFAVLGLSGNTMLGGDDMDAAIADRLLERLTHDYALDLSPATDAEDHLRMELLKFIGEGVKKELSTKFEFMLRNSMLQDKQGKTVIIDFAIERGDLESWLRPVVERTLTYCHEALAMASEKAKVSLSDVDAIILVGGSTHIPLVRQMVKEMFCADPMAREPRAKCVEPIYEKVDTIVALGAALRAADAGGLSISNAEQTLRITFRGTAATASEEATVSGTVESLSGQNLAGARIKLLLEGQEYDDEQPLRPDGGFTFRQIPLEAEATNLLVFELHDAGGLSIANFQRPIKQDVKTRRTIDVMPCLPKSISLATGNNDEVALTELLPALQRLPASAKYLFKHPGNTNLLCFELYQGKRFIQRFDLEVSSSLPRGTPIELSISADEHSFITVTGQVGPKLFDVPVTRPPDPQIPSSEKIADLEQKFRQALQYLDGGNQMVQKARYKKVFAAFESAKRRHEVGLAVNEWEELEDLVAAIAKAEVPLQPPKPVFDERIKELNDLILSAIALLENAKQPADPKEWQATLDTQREAGEKAYKERNKRELAEVFLMLESLERHILGTAKPFLPTEGPPKAQRAQWSIEAAQKDLKTVRLMAEAAEILELSGELNEIEIKLTSLDQEIFVNPDGVVEQTVHIRKRLEQIRRLLEHGPSRPGMDPLGKGVRPEKPQP